MITQDKVTDKSLILLLTEMIDEETAFHTINIRARGAYRQS